MNPHTFEKYNFTGSTVRIVDNHRVSESTPGSVFGNDRDPPPPLFITYLWLCTVLLDRRAERLTDRGQTGRALRAVVLTFDAAVDRQAAFESTDHRQLGKVVCRP